MAQFTPEQLAGMSKEQLMYLLNAPKTNDQQMQALKSIQGALNPQVPTRQLAGGVPAASQDTTSQSMSNPILNSVPSVQRQNDEVQQQRLQEYLQANPNVDPKDAAANLQMEDDSRKAKLNALKKLSQ